MPAYKDKAKGTWYVSFRYKNWKGETKQTMKRGFKTKKEAQAYEREYLRKVSGDFSMVLGDFVDIYFEDKKNKLKEVTVFNKRDMIYRHVLPYFGQKPMNEITPGDVIQWQNAIHELGYKPTYERMLQNQLNSLFNHAERIYGLQNNPCKKVDRMGKSDAEELNFWTKEEYDQFISFVDPESDSYLIFELLFWTGMREGELLALTPEDFDLVKNILRINKTYKRMKGKDIITTPKTDNSVRTIVLPNFLMEEVKSFLDAHYGMPSDERMFPIVARTLQKRLKTYIAKAGVKEIRVHGLRHSATSLLIYKGVPPIVIKERLGHKNVQFTLDRYGHLYPSEQIAIANMLDDERQNDIRNKKRNDPATNKDIS